MSRRNLVMIAKSFSEEISVQPIGPRSELTHVTTCVYQSHRRFRTSVELRPRFCARYYVTTMTVNQATEEYSYREYVEVQPRLRAKTFGETVFAFPKTVQHVFTTTLTHWANANDLKYTMTLELVPAEKLLRTSSVDEEDSRCSGNNNFVEMSQEVGSSASTS